ncbi:MAG: hypothetical protein C0513_07050 [Isosphaera sp.]|nr:hypothetical protein [Isosphaera sp.]
MSRWAGALLVAAGLMVPAAVAQPAPEPAPAQSAPEAPTLGGPRVETRDVPGAGGTFGTESARRRRGGEGEVPAAAFGRIVQKALGEQAPEAVRATPEQTEQIRAIMQAFQAEQRAFFEANRGALGAGRRGQRGAAGQADGEPMMAEDAQAERAAIAAGAELRAKAPKFADSQTKIWSILSAEQRAAVESEMKVYESDRAERASREYAQRQIAQLGQRGAAAQPGGAPPRRPGPPGAPGEGFRGRRPGPDGAPPEGRPTPPGNPDERLRKAIEQLTPEERGALAEFIERTTPEQRRALFQRLRERNGEGGPGGRRPGGPGAPGGPGGRRPGGPGPGAPEDRPAPPIEEIEVPAPRP